MASFCPIMPVLALFRRLLVLRAQTGPTSPLFYGRVSVCSFVVIAGGYTWRQNYYFAAMFIFSERLKITCRFEIGRLRN
jgi:hypothetical protein